MTCIKIPGKTKAIKCINTQLSFGAKSDAVMLAPPVATITVVLQAVFVVQEDAASLMLTQR